MHNGPNGAEIPNRLIFELRTDKTLLSIETSDFGLQRQP
jgi:hypothetical protein